MGSWLIYVVVAAVPAQVPVVPDHASEKSRFEYWQRRADQRCARSYSLDECRAASFAASASEDVAGLCRSTVEKRLGPRHGGPDHQRIGTDCAVSIEHCHASWRYFLELTDKVKDPPPTEWRTNATRQNIEFACGTKATVVDATSRVP